jgi:hypothetical protein
MSAAGPQPAATKTYAGIWALAIVALLVVVALVELGAQQHLLLLQTKHRRSRHGSTGLLGVG